MKHNRLLWFPILLLYACVSCNLPGPEQLAVGELQAVTSVIVTPHQSSGNFKAVVQGNYETNKLATLRCTVSDDPTFAMKFTDTFLSQSANGNKTASFSVDFQFSYIVLGTHSLVCVINNDNETAWSADFQVDLEPDQLTQGELRFAADKATANSAGMQPSMGCWPSTYYDDGNGYLKLTSTGTIEGICAWKSPSSKNPDVTWNTSGVLSGTYDSITGVVAFHLDTVADYPAQNNMKITVSFDGAGSFTSSTHAEGSATFRSTCQSPENQPSCGAPPPGSTAAATAAWDVSGTVPWTLDFVLWDATGAILPSPIFGAGQ
jgi:hypothetical protein